MDILMIKDGVVRSVSSVSSIEELQPYYPDMLLIERTGEEWEGWGYTNGEFTPPVGYLPPNPSKITQLAFLSRFTDAEAIAIDLNSQGNTISAAALRRETNKLNASTYIDLKRSDTIAGVHKLEQYGLIAPGRAEQILNTVPTSEELYRG